MTSQSNSGDDRQSGSRQRRGRSRVIERLDQLEQRMTELEAEVEAVADHEDTAESESLEKQVRSLQRAVGAIRKEHDELEEDVQHHLVDYLKDEQEVLKRLHEKVKDLPEVLRQLDRIQAQLEDVDSETSELMADIDDVLDVDDFNEYAHTVEEATEMLLGRVRKLETQVNALANEHD